jgi:altronate hydrolase
MRGDLELCGYLRHDGRKGIRNYLVVCYLVECAHQAQSTIDLCHIEQSP